MRYLLTLGIGFTLLMPALAFAQATSAGNLVAQTLGARGELCSQGICLPTEETPLLVWIVTAVFSILGIVFLCLMLYAGFLWMTAGGNTEQVKKAKRIMVQAVIGIIITLSSFAIANFVMGRLLADTSTVDRTTRISAVGSGAGISSQPIEFIIGRIIFILLYFLGVIFLVLTVYAGSLWMTAGGNTEQVAKAKRTLVQAVIGLTLILTAYGITDFVLDKLSPILTEGTTQAQ